MRLPTTQNPQDARSQLLEAALVKIRLEGPASVQPSEICKSLQLSKALVNYHFGGRGGLVAEALMIGLGELADEAEDLVRADYPSHLERLMAWTFHQVRWSVANPGLASAMAFPLGLLALDEVEESMLRDEVTALRQRRISLLTRLVQAARSEVGGRGAVEFADVVAVGWLCLGMATWSAGNQLSEGELVGLFEQIRPAFERLLSR